MDTIISRCPHCQANNRLPTSRLNENPTCGKCAKPVLSGAPIEATDSNFQALIASQHYTVVDFWATWCQPCVGFTPVFSEASDKFKDKARFVKVNTEAYPSLAAQFGIRSIPTIMVFQNGKVVNTINGALPAVQFQSWLTSNLTKPANAPA